MTNVKEFIMKTKSLLFTCFMLIGILPIAFGQAIENETAFRVDKGVVYCEKGIPESPRWFIDSRLNFQFDETGITQVDYYNPGLDWGGMRTIFLRQLWDGIRYYIEKGDRTFKPEFQNSKTWPFGIEAEWKLGGITLTQKVMAIDESIVIQITTPNQIPDDLKLKLELNETFGLVNGDANDFRFFIGNNVKREWRNWEFNQQASLLMGGFSERITSAVKKIEIESTPNFQGIVGDSSKDKYGNVNLYCGFGSDFLMDHSTTKVNTKHYMRTPLLSPNKTYSFVISFATSEQDLLSKNKTLVDNLANRIKVQRDRYTAVAESSPVLISPYKELNNFISLTPLYHESLKVRDFPGAIRAKNTDYWVWGWDGMTCNEATSYWGDIQHIKDMLRFYEEKADPKLGIAHAFRNDMSVVTPCPLPAQGMYICLLQLYYAQTGDLDEVKARYEFAKTIFNRTAEKEIPGIGLSKGSSMFPDFINLMGETGNDISSYNNTIFYCAARSMDYLAGLIGDTEIQKRAEGISKRMENNYIKYFYDADKGFVVTSIDAKTLEKRNCFHASPIRWENDYCGDLAGPMVKNSLPFFEKNLIAKSGVRETPIWNMSFDQDANQLHDWWPVINEFYMRMINENNRKDLVDQWIGWISYWTSQLTCPEAVSTYFETDKPEFDRWNTTNGCWQAFTMRPWYQGIIHGVVGVGTEVGGITFYPYSGEPMKLLGMHYFGRTFDFDMAGSGPFIESIEVDGKIIKGTNKLPKEFYQDKKHIVVKVNRVAVNPYPVSIVSGAGVEIINYEFAKGVIKTELTGSGISRLKIRAAKVPTVKIGGKKVLVNYDSTQQLATFDVKLMPSKLVKAEIKQ